MATETETSPAGAATSGLVAFALSGLGFAVPRTSVHSVLPMASLAEPPNRPPALAGFLILSDLALPVLRTAHLLSLPSQGYGPGTAVIRLRGKRPQALMVDRALAVLHPRQEDWRPVAEEHSFQGLVTAEVLVPGGVIGVLDPARLLLREEEDRIEAFRSVAEARRADLTCSPADLGEAG